MAWTLVAMGGMLKLWHWAIWANVGLFILYGALSILVLVEQVRYRARPVYVILRADVLRLLCD